MQGGQALQMLMKACGQAEKNIFHTGQMLWLSGISPSTGELSTACGYVDILPDSFYFGKHRRALMSLFQQKYAAYSLFSGRNPLPLPRIYKGVEFLHRDVDESPSCSTVYPKLEPQQIQGLEGLFHNVHKPFSYCDIIIYLLQLFSFLRRMHTVREQSLPWAVEQMAIRLEVPLCSLP